MHKTFDSSDQPAVFVHDSDRKQMLASGFGDVKEDAHDERSLEQRDSLLRRGFWRAPNTFTVSHALPSPRSIWT
jgi:hypothetical protein